MPTDKATIRVRMHELFDPRPIGDEPWHGAAGVAITARSGCGNAATLA